MKQLTILVVLLLGGVCAKAQTNVPELRKAIAYYQQLKFEESLNIFDNLIAQNPGDVALIGRRGFVYCQYIKAMHDNLVERVEDQRYMEIINSGIDDLTKSLQDGPSNPDNDACLKFLKSLR